MLGGCASVQGGSQFEDRHSCIPSRFKPSRHVQVRSDPNSGGSVRLTDVGEKKEHQQSTPARAHINMPGKVVVRIGGFARKTRVDVPSSVARVFRAWKPNGECPETEPGKPATLADQIVISSLKHWSIHSFPERALVVISEANDGPGPCRRVIGIATCVPPKNATPLIRQFSWKSLIDPRIPLLDELSDLFT
jgi:hypothetical protein